MRKIARFLSLRVVFVPLCVLREFDLCMGDSITAKKSRASSDAEAAQGSFCLGRRTNLARVSGDSRNPARVPGKPLKGTWETL